MTEPRDVVTQFCALWADVDVDKIMSYFADDAVYHNMPLDPLVGHAEIRTLIESFTAGVERVDFEIVHIVADGNVVLTERVDRFTYSDKVINLPVMGTFEVQGDKIVAWRDYFDLNQFMSQMG
jgi:limonene-1,2-epoxide hydrolase